MEEGDISAAGVTEDPRGTDLWSETPISQIQVLGLMSSVPTL